MKGQMELFPEEKDDRERIEPEAAEVSREFEWFCGFLLQEKIKLSKNTGYIGKKDCFALNGLLRAKENYEKPTRFQTFYPVIHFWHYVAMNFQILEIDEKGTGVQKGENWEVFHQASDVERFLLFALIFLESDDLSEDGYPFISEYGAFAEWFRTASPTPGKEYVLSLPARGYKETDRPAVLMIMEELGMLRVLPETDLDQRRGTASWRVEIRPLFGLGRDLHRSIREKGLFSEEEMADFCFGQFMEERLPDRKTDGDRKTGAIRKLFCEPEETDYSGQGIELEIRPRYHDSMRAVRMSLADTLGDLHAMIQKAFQFDDDHLYAFYVGHGSLRRTYMSGRAQDWDDGPSAEETRLGSLKLKKSQKFSYLFDFGDSWWFEIKVLKLLEERVEQPEIIRSEKAAPKQYPDWEE